VATRILLLRHGQSTWNASGRWQGWADAPLSGSGEAAAAAAAADPALDRITAAVSSDLQRAARTAEMIALARGWPPVTTFRGLRERGAGLWTGLTRAEIDEGWPGALRGRGDVQIPGGEAPAAVAARAVATLHRIAARWLGESVLAVTHGGVVRRIESFLGAHHAVVPNLGGRWVVVDAGVLTLGDRVTLAGPALDPIAQAE
jgi:probable phosphoglycerate mutase